MAKISYLDKIKNKKLASFFKDDAEDENEEKNKQYR